MNYQDRLNLPEVRGTYRHVDPSEQPADQSVIDWFREFFPLHDNGEHLVALAVVRFEARHVLMSYMGVRHATGVAYAAWRTAKSDRVMAAIYPFQEATNLEEDSDHHNFFWQVRIEGDESSFSCVSCPLEVLMALTPTDDPDAYRWRRECARDFPAHVFPELHRRLQLVFPAEGERWCLRHAIKISRQ